MSVRPDRLTLVAFVTLVVLAGGNAVGVRVSVHELSPFWAATLRFGIAGLLLAAVTVLLRRPIPRGSALLGASLFGLFNFGFAYVFTYVALRDAPAGTGQLILSIVPLLTIGLARAHGVERIRPAALAGATVAAVGIAIVVADQVSLDVPITALLLILGAAACMAESGVIAKRFPPGDPVAANAVGMLLGTALLAALSFVAGEPHGLPVRPETWLAVGYLVLFGSIGVFVLVLYVLAQWTVTATAYSFLLIPLVTIALGSILLHEPIQLPFVVGGAVVLLGVYIGAVYRPRRVVADTVAADAAEAASG